MKKRLQEFPRKNFVRRGKRGRRPASILLRLLPGSCILLFGIIVVARPEELWKLDILFTPTVGWALIASALVAAVVSCVTTRTLQKSLRLWSVLSSSLLLIFALMGAAMHQEFLSRESRSVRQKDASSTVRVAIVGDSGRGSDAQYAIGRRLAAADTDQELAGVFLLGDNIYGEDPYPQAVRERVKLPFAALIKQDVPLYGVLGNHDYSGGYATQELHDPLFHMEGRKYYHWTTGDGILSTYVIDTETFATDPFQYEWLEETMEDDDAQWKILLCHVPFKSSSAGHGESASLKRVMKALINETEPFDLVFAGHNHIYERSEGDSFAPYSVILGSSGKVSHIPRPEDPSLIAYDSEKEAYGVLQVTKNELRWEATASDGTPIDQFVLYKTSD